MIKRDSRPQTESDISGSESYSWYENLLASDGCAGSSPAPGTKVKRESNKGSSLFFFFEGGDCSPFPYT